MAVPKLPHPICLLGIDQKILKQFKKLSPQLLSGEFKVSYHLFWENTSWKGSFCFWQGEQHNLKCHLVTFKERLFDGHFPISSMQGNRFSFHSFPFEYTHCKYSKLTIGWQLKIRPCIIHTIIKSFFFKKNCLFWLHWVLVAALGIFSCGM